MLVLRCEILSKPIDTISDTYSNTEINQTKLSIGVGDLLRGNIQFKKIEINGAKFASVVKSQKSRGYHQQLMREKDKDLGKGIIMPTWLHEDGVDFTLTDVHFIETDTILNKAFDIKVNTINGYYNRNNSQLDGNFTFDASVNTLGFNTQKGTYFNGARVRGRPEFSIDLEKDFISVSEFLFKVDAQDFNLKANFDFSGIETYAFQLKNDNTNFESLKTLLPENMSSNLLLYDIDNPLKTDLDLSGNFLYNDDPVIDVIFSTQDNNILLDDRIQIENVSFDGHLTTEIYDTDSLKAEKRTGYDLKIGFKDLTATYDEIAIKVNNGYYQSSPDAWNIVKTDLSLVGDNASLTKLIDTDNFDFVGGTFQLETNINGDLSNINEFANNATGYFNLKSTRVVLKKNGLQLPISTIDLLLEREKSTLERLVVNFPNGENLVLQGQLKSISSLLSKNPKTPTTSTITVRSRALNINDVLSLANQFMPPSQQNIDNRKNLHETLDAVYNQFNPNFNMNFGALTYNDVTISDVTSDINLINDETIVLNNFNFNYLNTNTNLKGRVVVPKPNGQLRNPIFINALASSNGDISVFQDLFNIQLFRIDDGSYQFNGTINGNIHKFNALLNNAKGNLALNNTKLHYNQTDTDIEIDSLALFLDESDMILKKLNLEISELYTLNLSGKITEFQGFLIDEIPNKGAIELKISAPFLNANEVLTTFKDSKNEENLKVLKRKDALYKIFKDINNFKPKIEIAFDSLKYQDLLTKNVNGLVYFENDSLLKLKNLDFSYKQTTAKIKGQLNAHTQQKQLTNNNPFDIDVFVDIEGKSENLNSYFKTKNFNFTSGDFEFKGEYKAQSKDLKILNSKGFGDLKMMNTIVDYKVAGLKIPLDSLHINIEDNVASIKTIDINLPGKSSVFFSGSIDHFSDFLNNEQNDNGPWF